MPVRLHHIVVDTQDLPRLARFWTQALGWKVLSEREREIVIGIDENAPVGMCFMPVTDQKTVKNRVHLDLTSSAQDRDQEIDRLLALGARRVDIGQTGAGPGLFWPTLKATSSALCARRKPSLVKAQRWRRSTPVRGIVSRTRILLLRRWRLAENLTIGGSGSRHAATVAALVRDRYGPR